MRNLRDLAMGVACVLASVVMFNTGHTFVGVVDLAAGCILVLYFVASGNTRDV